MVKSVGPKLSGSSGLGGIDSYALLRWLLKVGDSRKTVCISVVIFLTEYPIIIHHGQSTGHLCLAA